MAAAKSTRTRKTTAPAALVNVELPKGKSTKNTQRYETTADDAAIRSVYVRNSALNGAVPETLRFRVFPRTAAKVTGALAQIDLDLTNVTKGGWQRFQTDADDAAVDNLYVRAADALPESVTLVVSK